MDSQTVFLIDRMSTNIYAHGHSKSLSVSTHSDTQQSANLVAFTRMYEQARSQEGGGGGDRPPLGVKV